jgi:hypothetical protein
MSQENIEVVKRAQPRGVDLVQMFRAFAAPDSTDPGIDLTVFETDCEVEFSSSQPTALGPPSSPGLAGLAEGWRDWLEPCASSRPAAGVGLAQNFRRWRTAYDCDLSQPMPFAQPGPAPRVSAVSKRRPATFMKA